MEERLEVAHRRRDPGGLLDLEGQLARRRPIGAGPDVMIVAQPARTAAIASALASSAAPDSEQSRRARCPSPTGELVGDRRRGDDRRQVADRVAPAVVHLDRRDDELRRRAATAAPAGDPAQPVIIAVRARAHRPPQQVRGAARLLRRRHRAADRGVRGALQVHAGAAERRAGLGDAVQGRRRSRHGDRARPGPRCRHRRRWGRISLGIFFAETNGNQNIGNGRSNTYKGSLQTGTSEDRRGRKSGRH